MKSAFLVPFFGDLPAYFSFWAKSCETNHENFHWFVYNDRTASAYSLNEAVTMIPYQFDEMIADFKKMLSLKISGYRLRNVCDYRIMFYFLRRDREPLDDFDFIGYTDMDMIYGRLSDFLPSDMSRYAMISADDGKPCGPFTLISRSAVQSLSGFDKLKLIIQNQVHVSFNEAEDLMNFVSGGNPVFCHTDPLQPARTPGFNFRKTFSVWDKGRVKVWDNRGNEKEGGFYHFSRYKNKHGFRVKADALDREQWAVYRYGITDIRSKWMSYLLKLSLVI
jgi:hypothetical protein